MNILLIEDNQIDQMAFLRMIEKEAITCQVEVVESIKQAKTILLQKKFQCIICDLNLPDGTAFELAPFIAENRFILLSGHVDPELKEKANLYGIRDVFQKTSELKQFLQIFEILTKKVEAPLNEKKLSKSFDKQRSENENIEKLKIIFDNDTTYIAEVINTYLTENPKLVSKLNHAVKEKNQIQIMKTAHQLKSGFMMMGLKELELMAKKLETDYPDDFMELEHRVQAINQQTQLSYERLNNALLNLDPSL